MSKPRPTGHVSYDNRGRVVLVTGGASGIGLAVCQAFASSHAQVICADVAAPHDDAFRELVEYRRVDVSKEVECRELIESIVEQHGGIDVVVNNAAIQPVESYVPADKLPTDLLEQMLRVNFLGYQFIAKYALPVMKSQQTGVIVNMASGQGHRTARGVPAYGPIKAANILQAMQWGVEYARAGVRVVSVSPGAINTPLVQASLAQQGGAAALANRHPVGRLGEPEEVAHAVLWLSSHDASFVTATDLSVDGGLDALGAFADPYPMPDETAE